jgi:hypothetical protein
MTAIDIHLEFDPLAVARTRDPTRTVAEASHYAATEAAREIGATLRHPEPVEVVTTKAVTPQGADVLLVATRWTIDGADAARSLLATTQGGVPA